MTLIALLFLGNYLIYLIGRSIFYNSPFLFGAYSLPLELIAWPSFLYAVSFLFAILGFWSHTKFNISYPNRGLTEPLTSKRVSLFNTNKPTISSINKYAAWFLILSIFVLTIQLSSYSVSSVDFVDRRYLTHLKVLPFVLISWGAMGGFLLNTLSNSIFKNLFLAISFAPLIVFGYVEASRQALLGAGSFFLTSIVFSNNVYASMTTSLPYLISVVLCFSLGRDNSDLGDLTVNADRILLFLQYPTGFSFGNFARQIIGVDLVNYTWINLFGNMSPLPSSFLEGSSYFQLFDQFSPVAASVSLYSLNIVLLLAYWSLYGYLFAGALSKRNPLLKSFMVTIMVLLFIVSFQYSARNAFRLISVNLLLEFASRLRLRT